MENYIMLDGVKIELTEEQIKTIRGASGKKKSPFDRVKDGEEYFIIVEDFKIIKCVEHYDEREDKRAACANYCTDRELMEQRALHEKLSRMLWRFAIENNEEFHRDKWYVFFDADKMEYGTCDCCYIEDETTKFSSEEIAKRAIKEIIEPFMEKHPDFKWGGLICMKRLETSAARIAST